MPRDRRMLCFWTPRGGSGRFWACKDFHDAAVVLEGAEAVELGARMVWSLRGGEQASPGFMELAFRLGTWLLDGRTERVCGAGLERGRGWARAVVNFLPKCGGVALRAVGHARCLPHLHSR